MIDCVVSAYIGEDIFAFGMASTELQSQGAQEDGPVVLEKLIT